MMVVLTDAPLDSRNLERLAKRAMLGLSRTGGIASNGSGDYVIAVSTAEACRICARMGGGFLVENPRPWDGYENIWLLEEMKDLIRDTDAELVDFDQCRFAGEAQKPTRVMHYKCNGHLLEKFCNHAPQQWRDPVTGKCYWAAHERVVQRWRADGRRATKALGAWPGPLNESFAMLIHAAGPRNSNKPWGPSQKR